MLQEVDDGPYTVTLQDIRGRVMKEEQLVAAGNSAMGIMDLRMLPKGIYLVRLLGANGCVLQTSRLELF